MTLAALFAILAAGALAPLAGAAPGSLDPSFGDGGRVLARTVAETAPSEFSAAVREPGGDLLVELRHDTIGGIGSVRKIELRTPKGALVPSFGQGGRVAVERGAGLAALPDGEVLVGAGECGGARSSVELLDRRGAKVASFGTDGCAAPVGFDPEYVSVDAQGRILLGGYRTYCPCSKSQLPPSETVLARLLPDGSPDPSFGEDGVVGGHANLALEEREGYAPAAMVGTADGGVLVAAGPGLIRLDPSGARDPSYGVGGIARAPGGANALLVEPDGSALLTSGGFESYAHASRFTPDGRLDPSFGSKGTIVLRTRPHSTLGEVVPLAGGGYLAAGQEKFTGDCDPCEDTPFLERLTAAGRPDPSYGKQGIAVFKLPLSRFPEPATQRALVVDPDGAAVVFGNDYQQTAIALARNARGAPRASFGRRGVLTERHAHPVQLAPTGLALTADDGLTLLNERFTAPGIVSGFQAKFDADGRQLRGPGGAPAVETLSHGKVVPIRRGIAIWEESEPEYILHALRTAGPNGLPIKGYGRNGNGRAKYPKGFVAEAVSAAPGGGLLAVGRVHEGTMAAFRIGPDGHPLRSFGDDGLAKVSFPHAASVAYAGLAQPDGGVVLTGQDAGHFVAARLLPDGRLDRRYGHGGRVRVHLRGGTAGGLIAAAGGGVVIAALKVEESRYVLGGLVRLDPRGRLVRGFGKGGIAHAVAERHPLAIFDGGGRIVVVNDPLFEKGHEGGGVELRSYRPDGSVDRAFGTGGVRFFGAGSDEEHAFTPAAAVQQSDGKVVVAGTARDGKRAKAELLRFLVR
jgi:uncharacterized delta-60 repeat protein